MSAPLPEGTVTVLFTDLVGSTRLNQNCPGLGAQIGPFKMREASYGYGWMIQASDRWRHFSPSLPSRGSYSHTGAGGIQFWVDPANEIVGVYFEVTMDLTEGLEPVSWSCDLFQNIVTSAVDD